MVNDKAEALSPLQNLQNNNIYADYVRSRTNSGVRCVPNLEARNTLEGQPHQELP